MKINFRTGIALVIVILVAGIGPAQASQPQQADGAATLAPATADPIDRWFIDYIQTNYDAGSHVSIAFDPDHDQAAWISYYNATYGSLWVAHYVGASGGNCGPGTYWFCEQVDQEHAESRGWYTSIDVFPDIDTDPMFSTWKVGVSYYDASHRSLKYAQYKCPPMGTCTWTVSTVDSSSDSGDEVGQFTSLKFASTGIPNIAYYAYDDPDPTFATHSVRRAYFMGSGAGNCGDGSDWYCETVDSSMLTLGLYPSLDFDYSGNVYIAYYDGLNSRLKYAYYAGIGDCGTDNAWICLTIDDTAGDNVGLYPSFHAPQDSGDVLRVAYYDATAGKLKYAYARNDSSGNCGPGNSFQCNEIDDMGIGLTQASISLAVDSNYTPMIAYTDGHEDLAPLGLKVAQPAYGQPYANCAGEILYDWWCVTVDNGNQYVDEARYVSLGIKPNGLAMIAYSEWEIEYPGDYDLKIAYQAAMTFLPVVMK